MAKRRAESGEEKGNWLDTYADMVTLLLCFFVLLYSASSVDETKWQYIYQSFTSSGSYINPFVMDEQPKNNAADTNGNAEAPPNTQNGGTTSEQTHRKHALSARKQANRQRVFPPTSISFTAS